MLFASYVMLERVTSFNRLALRHVLPSLMRFADPCSVHMSIHCSIVLKTPEVQWALFKPCRIGENDSCMSNCKIPIGVAFLTNNNS